MLGKAVASWLLEVDENALAVCGAVPEAIRHCSLSHSRHAEGKHKKRTDSLPIMRNTNFIHHAP